VPFYQGLLAEIEAQEDAAGALIRTDKALALARETGEHWSDALLHRLRGEVLLKRDPPNTAQTEDASSPQSPSRRSRRRAVLSFAQFSIWQDCINPRAVPLTLMPCWRLPSRAFRRPRNFPREEAQTLLTALTS
jgi:hypothetical protein